MSVRSSGVLRTVDWKLFTVVSRQLSVPYTRKDYLILEDGTDRMVVPSLR